MRKIILFICGLLIIILTGCGITETDTKTEVETVYVPQPIINDNPVTVLHSTSDPRVAYIQHSADPSLECVVIAASRLINLSNYRVESHINGVIRGITLTNNNSYYTEDENSIFIFRYINSPGARYTSPVFLKGISHLVFKDPEGNIIQEADL